MSEALEEFLAESIDVSVAGRFPVTGADYYQAEAKKEGSGQRVHLNLTREERAVFCRELGLEMPGG